jgi:5-methyltetrahydrofolate--homocysteine methyltransferase
MCLSDFIAPKGIERPDYIGAFVVTTGAEEERISEKFARDNDDYRSIMVKALADRFAEAFAERMHQLVRRDYWGYAPDEALSNEDLIREEYRGIRPAPGYPACPDHSQKQLLFPMLDAPRHTGITLTDSLAMWPTASVSGFYFGHPQSEYFGVARIGRDQLEDYARRRDVDIAAAERWLRPNLD